MATHLRTLLPSLLMGILFVLGNGCASSASGAGANTMPDELAEASSPDSHRRAASELVRRSLSQESLDALIRISLDGVLQANPALHRFRSVFEEFFATYFTVDNMVSGIAPLYEERFSELELRQMLWFYSTPVGARALAELPALTNAGAAVGEQIVREHQAELERMIQEYLLAHPDGQ